jgi:hypothetical protein
LMATDKSPFAGMDGTELPLVRGADSPPCFTIAETAPGRSFASGIQVNDKGLLGPLASVASKPVFRMKKKADDSDLLSDLDGEQDGKPGKSKNLNP